MATNKAKQKNQYGFSTPPPTEATTNLQNMVNNPVDYATPIRNAYGRAEKQYESTYKNPLGAYTTADVRDKSIREHGQEMNQQEGLDLSNAAQQTSQNQFNRQATVAGFTSPIHELQSTSQPFTGGDAANIGIQAALGFIS